MKNIISIFILSIWLITSISNAQDITNTLAPNGSFKIKDSTTDYFILNQANGTISLNSPLAGNLRGSIFKGGTRFLHTYNGSGTDGFNTFIGLNAGNFTMGGANLYDGSYNTGVGYQSLSSLTTGAGNSAFGFNSLYSNTTGNDNSAFGFNSLRSNINGLRNSAFGVNALYSNTDGYFNSAFGGSSLSFNITGSENSAFGVESLKDNLVGSFNSAFGRASLIFNQTGNNNSAFGYFSLALNLEGINNSGFGYNSLYSNTIGASNSAFGTEALYSNTSDYNSAFGYQALYANTSGFSNAAFGWNTLRNNVGSGNTAFGTESLYQKTSGDYNTSIGYFSGYNITTGSNNITIGHNAQVPNNTGSNQIRMGDVSIGYAGIQVAWTVTSDRRWKENIQTTNLGLGFITKLNPVSYSRKNDEKHKTEFGLIAQALEEVLKSEGIENTGMLNVTDEGYYELRYNDLFAPMIKAIQELKSENDQLREEMKKLVSVEEQLAEIKGLKEELIEQIHLLKTKEEDQRVKFSSNNN